MGELADILMWKGLVRSHLPQGQFTDRASLERINSMMLTGFTPEEAVKVLITNDKPVLDSVDQHTRRLGRLL